MQDQALSFAGSRPQADDTDRSDIPDLSDALVWSFDPNTGLDRPFHDLVSQFGVEIIEELDSIVLDTPVRAAVRATKIYQSYAAQSGRDVDTDGVMRHFASTLKPVIAQADESPLVPEPAVYRGRGERMGG